MFIVTEYAALIKLNMHFQESSWVTLKSNCVDHRTTRTFNQPRHLQSDQHIMLLASCEVKRTNSRHVKCPSLPEIRNRVSRVEAQIGFVADITQIEHTWYANTNVRLAADDVRIMFKPNARHVTHFIQISVRIKSDIFHSMTR